MRVRHGRVQTAAWVLRHLETGRTVTLVGTMHIGDAPYFACLSELLGELATGGAEVHVEGIGHRDEDQLSGLERRRLAEARQWTDPERSGVAVALLEAESQRTLRLPEEARNIDLSHAALLRRIGWKEYRRLFRPGPGGHGRVPESVLRAAICFQVRHHRELEALRALSPRHRRINRVVIGERDAVAFAGATATLQEGRDVALVWGCDHLPGLARLFRANGYRLRRWRWFDACAI